MKIFVTILLILGSQIAKSQTVIPAATSVHDFMLMKSGLYRVITQTDTLDIAKDTSKPILTAIPVIVKHDTTVKTVIVRDTFNIPAPPVKQRTAISITWDGRPGVVSGWIVTYDTGEKSAL